MHFFHEEYPAANLCNRNGKLEVDRFGDHLALHKKLSFSLRYSSVTFTDKIFHGKLNFCVAWDIDA